MKTIILPALGLLALVGIAGHEHDPDAGKLLGRGLGHGNGFQCLGQRSNLVEFNQNRVGNALVNPTLEDRGIGDKQIIAHQLNAAP